ncbi:MAG: mannose-1-phosphate guanylyltransferase [bacterium]
MYAVIMAGGSGTRFWPKSRRNLPKQFIRLNGRSTMIQKTVARLKGLIEPEHVLIVTGKRHADLARNQLPQIPSGNFLLEPVGRNTATCIGLAAFYLRERDPEQVMVVLPADHLVKEDAEFQRIVRQAVEVAEQQDKLVTLGIKPTHPETGFGYIVPEKQPSGKELFKVNRFTEKPDQAMALKLINEEAALWNSGMFIWKTSTILSAFKRFLPQLYKQLDSFSSELAPGAVPDEDETAALFNRIEPISIDNGIAERADNMMVIPSDFGWSDVGSWAALGEVFAPDNYGNVTVGNHLLPESEDNIVYAPERLVAAIGVENLIIVDTPEALLVCPKEKAQEIKKLVENHLPSDLL